MGFKKSNFAERKFYNIGDMVHTVKVQKRYQSNNDFDDLSVVNKFETIFEVNCYWKVLKPDFVEYDEDGLGIAEKIKSIKNAEMIIPYRNNIDCECYVLYKSIRYKIIDIQNVDNMGMFLKCSLMTMGNEQLKGNEGI